MNNKLTCQTIINTALFKTIQNIFNKKNSLVLVYFTPFPIYLYDSATNQGNLAIAGVGLGLIYSKIAFCIFNATVFSSQLFIFNYYYNYFYYIVLPLFLFSNYVNMLLLLKSVKLLQHIQL